MLTASLTTNKVTYNIIDTPYSGKYWRALNSAKQLSKAIGELKFGNLQVHALPIRVCDILICAQDFKFARFKYGNPLVNSPIRQIKILAKKISRYTVLGLNIQAYTYIP